MKETEGAEKIIANLNAQLSRIRGVTPQGLLAGGFIIQRNSQKRVPVEYGFMKASAYTRRMPENEMVVEVGYTAAYAAQVHENLEMKLAGKPRPSGIGTYWGPRGESQFLLKAVRDTTKEVVDVVANYARVR